MGLRALSYILSWWTKQNNKLIIDSTLLEILKKKLICSFMHFKKRHPPGAQRKDQISKGGTMALKEDMQDVHCKKKNNSCLAVRRLQGECLHPVSSHILTNTSQKVSLKYLLTYLIECFTKYLMHMHASVIVTTRIVLLNVLMGVDKPYVYISASIGSRWLDDCVTSI